MMESVGGDYPEDSCTPQAPPPATRSSRIRVGALGPTLLLDLRLGALSHVPLVACCTRPASLRPLPLLLLLRHALRCLRIDAAAPAHRLRRLCRLCRRRRVCVCVCVCAPRRRTGERNC